MTAEAPRIGLAEWLQALRSELHAAQQAAKDDSLRFTLDAVEIEFEVATSRETAGRGGVRFWVVEGSAEHTRAVGATQRLKLLLTPDAGLKSSDRLAEPPE